MALRKKDETHEGQDKSTMSGSAFPAASQAKPCPVVTILAHPDPARVGERCFLYGLLGKKKEPISRLEPLFTSPRFDESRPLADCHLSRKPVTISRASSGELLFDGTRSPMSLSVDGEAVDQRLRVAGSLDQGVVLLLAGKVLLYLHEIDFDGSGESSLVDRESAEGNLGLVGESPALARVRQRILPGCGKSRRFRRSLTPVG